MEETTKLITAKEAGELAFKGAVTVDGICESIRRQATNGYNFLRLFDILVPPDVLKYLLTNGFSVSQATGMMGEEIFIVRW